MLDTWVKCKPSHLSSEYPIPICKVEKEICEPGGAANVAASIQNGYGIDVELIGLVGYDKREEALRKSLVDLGVSGLSLIASHAWNTIEKRRFVDELGRQFGLRLDTEDRFDLVNHPSLWCEVQEQIVKLSKTCDVLVISDYNKGTCTEQLVQEAIALFHQEGKYTIVNGKPAHFNWYTGADLVVFNQTEAAVVWRDYFLGCDIDNSFSVLAETIKNCLDSNPIGCRAEVLITLGAAGMVYVNKEGQIYELPAEPANVADVAGAGDVVVSTIAANGRCDEGVLSDAAYCAADAISRYGTSRIDAERLVI
jgi:D-beta-D-heptose 7-phosphate kinase/D-beta-D-heptose 1-phosphate adenosyltransferase